MNYECLKSFSFTGGAELFTKGLIYKSEHINCLTDNFGCKYVIVMENKGFDFDQYFKPKK